MVLICITLSPFYLRMLYAKFGLNWSFSYGEEFFKNIFGQYIFAISCLDLPLKKDMTLHLNKLESPSPKDALCQVWLKLACWFWRKYCF